MNKEDIQIDVEMLRTNTKIISSPREPVYTSSVSTNNPALPVVIKTTAEAYAQLGKRFSFNTAAQSMTANGYLALQITIPANWGKTMYIDRLRVGTSTSSIVDCMPASITGTTPLTATNSNFGSANTTSVTGGYLITTTNPTTATPVQTCILTSGTLEINYDGRFVIPSKTTAQNYTIRVMNTGAGSSSGMITFAWWEI